MLWNWQLSNWPNFTFDKGITKGLEEQFIEKAGMYKGSLIHLRKQDKNSFIIDILSNEAFCSSEMEGQILNRDSLYSSICNNLGIKVPSSNSPAEEGMAKIMTNLYTHYKAPLSKDIIFKWHSWLMSGRNDLWNIGSYRKNKEPMQIISGPIGDPKVHFEAPPPERLLSEMKKYILWFNQNAKSLPLLHATIGHVYFESIHPFEDGNGRIGRILVIKSLSQSANQPLLIALSEIIQQKKKQYYESLQLCNNALDITEWILYFAQTILKAQDYSIKLIELIIYKSKVMKYFKEKINKRQEKAILRILHEGPKGFSGGLSVSNYMKITKISRATATRDLQDLVQLGLLFKKGELKGTRYYLRYDLEL